MPTHLATSDLDGWLLLSAVTKQLIGGDQVVSNGILIPDLKIQFRVLLKKSEILKGPSFKIDPKGMGGKG